MLWVEEKYARFVGAQLDRFSVSSQLPFVAMFRCPYCGDSKKDKTKRRGYFYTGDDKLFFTCHNCSVSTNIQGFLRDNNDTLYKEYLMEVFAEKSKHTKKKKKPLLTPSELNVQRRETIKAVSLTLLQKSHPTRKYAESRMIPEDKLGALYHTDNFRTFVNGYLPDKLESTHAIPRLVMPFVDKTKHVFGCQGRIISGFGPRYITLNFDDRQRAFGEDRLDGPPYICEGPLDSLFLNNGLASCGSDLNGLARIHKKPVLVFDNEPRSPEICGQIIKAMDADHSIVIWPDEYSAIKDLNDLAMVGQCPQSMVDNNTFKGLSARLKFSNWKRC